MEHGDGSVEMGQWGNFFLVVFCNKIFFMEMGQWGNFFWISFVWSFYMEMGQWGSFFFLSFVNMGTARWRSDSVASFFVPFFPSPVTVAIAQKYFHHKISVLNNINRCRCPLDIFCQKKFRSLWVLNFYMQQWKGCLSQLPVTVASLPLPLSIAIAP